MATATASTSTPATTSPPLGLAAVAGAFKLAGDPTRLHVLMILAAVDEDYVDALCARVGMAQPTLSAHLALLRVSGIVEARRAGKRSYYSLTPKGKAVVAAARKLAAMAPGTGEG